MPKDGDQVQLYNDTLFRAIAEDPRVRWFAEPGREFLYRPGELLAAPRDLARVADRLREQGHQFREGEEVAGIARLVLDPAADVPAIVTDLRDPRQWTFLERVPAVQPHHVTIGFPNVMGNPFGPPITAAALPDPDKARQHDGVGITVGIYDTGIWQDATARHPLWLGGSYLPTPDDHDPLYQHDDVLAMEGGHGTFVAGVLRQAAPGVRFDPEPACDATGIGDESMLAAALAGLDPVVAIVNLSLGCFTQDNLAPLPLANALAALPPEAVVVASAGNAGTNRPSWPAAFDQVVAVVAVTRTDEGLVPADYSSFGPWVDACADGDRVSTFVDGTWELPGAVPVQFTGFARWVGTSFAAPHVAGQLATLMTTYGFSASEARQQLLGSPRWHPDYGVLVE